MKIFFLALNFKTYSNIAHYPNRLTMLHRVSKKVSESAMRKKGIPEALVVSVMSLCKGARTKVKVGTHFSEEFEVNAGVHQASVLSPLLFAIVVDVVTNKIKEGMLQEILYADDIVFIAESMA